MRNNWWDNLSNTLSQVTTAVGVVTMLVAGWAVIWTWVREWDWVQKGSAIFIGLALAFLLLLALYTWWRKTQVYKIPMLLYRMDGILRDYVVIFDPSKTEIADMQGLVDDLSDLMHIATYPLFSALRKQDKRALAEQTARYNRSLGTPVDPSKNSGDTLKTLMQISSLMNAHNVGLNVVKQTLQYQELFKKVSLLERIQPDPQVSIKIDSYLRWSDGLYSQLIGMRFITSKPETFALLPAEYRAVASYSQPVMEDYVDVLIANVAEALHTGKKKAEGK